MVSYTSTTVGDRKILRANNQTTVPVNGKYYQPTAWVHRTVQHKDGLVDKYTTSGSYSYSQTPNLISYADIGTFGILPVCPGDVKINLVNQAIANTINSQAQFGESFASANESLDLVTSNVKRIGNFVQSLRRGKAVEAARALGIGTSGFKNLPKDLSGKYLEYMFGLMPLLQDIDVSYQLLAEGIYSQDRKKGMHVRTFSSYAEPPYRSGRTWYRHGALRGYAVNEREITYQCYLNYRSKGDDALNRLDRYGLGNPALIAWQTTRLSFVFDWALPVSDFLQGLSSTRNLEYLDGAITTKGKGRCHLEDAYCAQAYLYKLRYLPVSTNLAFAREPVIRPHVRLPRPRLPNSLGQAVTATALLFQMRK